MRIASLSPAATEILFALGAEERIVCADRFSNFPEEAKWIPHLREHQKIEPDALAAFEPELVLTGTVIQAKLAEALRTAGFSVVHQDPRRLGDVAQSIRELGQIVDAEAAAEALVLRMQQGFNAVKKKAAMLRGTGAAGRGPRVYVEEWHDPPMASGNWVPETVRIAGGEPFPIAPGELSREISLLEIQRFDPDLIVVSWCGAGLLADKNLLLRRPGWDGLRAVREGGGRVHVIDDSLLNRPGPRLVEGAQRIYGWIFELLH